LAIPDIGHGIAVENHEVGVKSRFNPALLRRLEVQRGIRRQGGEHLALLEHPVHEFVFERGVIAW
jgi:hypothetical protein